jgi:hypothetical protein
MCRRHLIIFFGVLCAVHGACGGHVVTQGDGGTLDATDAHTDGNDLIAETDMTTEDTGEDEDAAQAMDAVEEDAREDRGDGEDAPGDGEEAEQVEGCVGDPCSSDDECECVPGSGRECLYTISGYVIFHGGYCTARCTSHAECGSGARCVEITTGTRYCLKLCTSSSQCRMTESYMCTTIPMSSDTNTYCLPGYDGEY